MVNNIIIMSGYTNRYGKYYNIKMKKRKELSEFLKGFKNKFSDEVIRFSYKGKEYDVSMGESHRGVLTGYMLYDMNRNYNYFKNVHKLISYLCGDNNEQT